jgi:peptide/nickel transport system substrate-binding protein
MPNQLTTTRRAFLGSLLAPAALALLAACGPGAPQAQTGAAQPTPAPTPVPAKPGAVPPVNPVPTTAAASKPAGPTGTLNVVVATEPATLDPQFGNGLNEFMLTINMMDGLVRFGSDLKIEPLLAETYRQVDDTTWEFKLRPNIKFHNGEALTSEAVKASFERSNDDSLKIRNPWWSEINLSEIEIVDPLNFRFHTSTPTPQMLSRLAKDYPIFPPKYLADTDPKAVARKAVGTGPYVFKEWQSGDHITMEANPDYWGTPKPSVKTVVWRWIPEHTSRLANLRTGAADLMLSLDPSSIADVNADPNTQAVVIQGGRRVYVGLNTTVGALKDVRVRQALNYAADVEGIGKAIFGGATQRMKTWTNAPYDNPDVKGYTYDPDKARQLLEAAGAQNLELTWDVDDGSYLKIEEFPPALANSLRTVGVNVSIRKIDNKVAAQEQRDRKTSPMYLRSNTAQYDPGLDFDVWRFDHAGNATQWNDSEFLGLLKQLYTGGTPEQRQQWSNQAQVRIMDQAPAIFLWKQPELYAISKKVQGFKPNGTERFMLNEVSMTA